MALTFVISILRRYIATSSVQRERRPRMEAYTKPLEVGSNHRRTGLVLGLRSTRETAYRPLATPSLLWYNLVHSGMGKLWKRRSSSVFCTGMALRHPSVWL